MADNRNHYNRSGLTEAILAALAASGKNPAEITVNDLIAIDELHVRGRKATMELAQKLLLHAGSLVLDIGSGIGGAARYLAETFSCRVIGVDLTFEYCRAAAVLGSLTGFANRTSFLQGNATALPFPDATFDCVWTIHTAMNIPDKQRLYGEITRVLRPGGTLALYDILAGDGGAVCTPVPWAREPSQSHLATLDELRRHLEAAGLAVTAWRDMTEEGRIWFSRLAERTLSSPPQPLGMQLLFGDDFSLMARNQVRNLNEGRIVLIECLAVRQE